MALLAGSLAPDAALPEELPVADPGRVFASWDQWETARGEFVAALDAFDAIAEGPIDSPERLLAVLEARDRAYRTGRSVEGYIYLLLQLDGTDEEARSRQRLLDETDRRWYTQGLPRFTGAITELGRERAEEWAATEEALAPYAFFLRRFFDRADHPFPEGQEDLRALSGVFGRQSRRLYNAVAVSEAPAVSVTLESGEALQIGPASARTILEELPSASDRLAVSRAWHEALGRRSQTYAALLEGVVGREKLLAEVRGFDSALAAQLHADGIPADAVRAVIRAARASSAPLRRYHALRKRLLGLEEYGLADRFVSLERNGREYDFEEAQRLIVASTSILGPEIQALVRRAFDDGWIDAVERPGKRAHGGSTFVAGHPFVLVNFRGTLDNLFQLTHEIGHAVHALVAWEAQPFVSSHRSSLTSETVASVFEGALVDHLARQATNREEKIRALDLSIQNTLRLFYRPMLEADFELRLYETGVAITGPSLGALYLAVVAEFYGDSVSLDEWDRHGWQRTPHFYTSPLYMGRYGLASAAAGVLMLGLTAPDVSEAAAAQRAFADLMRAGAGGYPLDLLRQAGAGLDDSRTFEARSVRLESTVGELERVVAGD